ncbi:MAG: hypothetical protein WCR51_04915 [Planctomycetia bacterium]
MGRETTILLAILGVLGGAFMGVLSMKLLVPRPPVGAGPDVDPQEAVVVRQDIVDPPGLEPRSATPSPPQRRDPFVTRSAFSEPAAEPSDLLESSHLPAATHLPETSPDLPPVDAFPRRPTPQPVVTVVEPPPSAPTPIAGSHTTALGDTWWSIAERAYGDGRLYRALFAWNRRLDPRVSTTPGTRLEIPPQPRLAAAWPTLMPEARHGSLRHGSVRHDGMIEP